jgi:hypothetical protein
MIPNYQKVIVAFLLLASLAMGGVLWRLRERAHERLVAGQDSAPTRAPEVAPAEQATLLVANDTDGSLAMQAQSLPLPADSGARAHALLGRLLDLYAAPGAQHPVPGGASSVAQVFLLPIPGQPTSVADGSAQPPARNGAPASVSSTPDSKGPELAVVNLTAGFAATHPSGIETETLTLISIGGTLRANLPRITQVRFLVDGKPRATLAGHADLTRTYLTADSIPTVEPHQ